VVRVACEQLFFGLLKPLVRRHRRVTSLCLRKEILQKKRLTANEIDCATDKRSSLRRAQTLNHVRYQLDGQIFRFNGPAYIER
jgi:hypothetical protein